MKGKYLLLFLSIYSLLIITSCSNEDDDEYVGNWVRVSDLDGKPRSNASSFVIGSKGYLTGGYDGDSYYNDLWEYDPDLNYWTQKATMPSSKRSSAVAFNTSSNGYNMAGFPESRRASDDKYNKYKISDIISSDQNILSLRLEVAHLSHSDISGFSGGGIIKFNEDYLTICGIQSRTPEEDCNGEISVVPIMRFIEIAKQHNLPELLPSFLVNFKFLQQDAFNFNASIDDDDISFTRLFLKQKTEEVLSSDITPRFIKDYFTDRLLINDKNMLKLNDELIYITWLEFLTLINIVKDKTCNISDLEDIFCYLRLLYRKTDTDWLETDFLKDCLVSNYDGLEENGTVFIKTNKPPIKSNIKHYKLDKGSIIPRIDSLKSNYENGTLNSDVNNITNALAELKEFVFEKYNFIHFEYLKHFMLVENSENYKTFKKSNENELLTKLKEEYGKIFGI